MGHSPDVNDRISANLLITFFRPSFHGVKQREREGIVPVHKIRAERGTGRSCAVITYEHATQASLACLALTPQGSTYAASYGDGGT